MVILDFFFGDNPDRNGRRIVAALLIGVAILVGINLLTIKNQGRSRVLIQGENNEIRAQIQQIATLSQQEKKGNAQ